MTPILHPDFLRIPLAHRALHDVSDSRPENSRAAVRAALAFGYGIEIDLQLSSDEHAMVFHDYNLARLSESEGPLKERSARDLGRIRLRFGEEGIPSLQEILDIVAGQVPVLIELKDQDGAMGPNVGPLERSVARALQDYEGPVAVMSFNPHSTRAMADLLPDVARGLVSDDFDAEDLGLPEDVCARLRNISDYESAGCSFISHDHNDLTRPRVSELKAAGAHILCWTVKSPQQEAAARKIAENITFERYLAAFPA